MSLSKPIRIIITGVDKFSAVSGVVSKQLDQMAQRVGRVGASMQKLGVTLLGAGAGAAIATGLNKLPGAMIRAETALASLQDRFEITPDRMEMIKTAVKTTARDTNRTIEEMIKVVSDLMQEGLSPENAILSLSAIGKAATGTKASVESLVNATFGVSDVLGIVGKDAERALDIMAMSAKKGKFAFNELVQEFPRVAVASRSMGMRGTEGVARISAAMQVVRGTAVDAGQAAKDAEFIFKRLLDPATLAKLQSIPGVGVDIAQMIEKVRKEGGDPLEEMLKLVDRLTASTDATKRGQRIAFLFDDKTTRAVTTLLDNLETYKKIRDESAKADRVINKSFERQMGTMSERWTRFQAGMAEAAEPTVGKVLDIINDKLVKVNANSKITKALVGGIGVALASGTTLATMGTITSGVASAIELLAKMGMTAARTGKAMRLMWLMTTGPIGIAVASIIALIAAYKGLTMILDSNRKTGTARERTKLQAQFPNATPEQLDQMASNQFERKEKVKNAMQFGSFATMASNAVKTGEMEHPSVDVNVKIEGLPKGSKAEVKKKGSVSLETELGFSWGGF